MEIKQIDYAPTSESGLIMPMNDLVSVVNGIREDLASASLQKSAMIVDPDVANKEFRGMHSSSVDPLQAQKMGEYYERPSNLSWENMRRMVQQTPILESIVLTRTRQIQRFCKPQEGGRGLGFAIRHIDPDHKLSKQEQESVLLLEKFILNCGWEFKPRERKRLKRSNFSTFMARSVRDSLIMDSAPIETEMKKDRSLGIDGFYAVDGSTIRLATEDGFRGDEDVFALQVVNGRIMTAYTMDDLIYEPRNPRTDIDLAGYGMSEVELLVKIVTGFLNALQLNLRGFSDNNIPRGFINLIGDYSKDDLASFRRYWNAMVTGSNSSWNLPVLTAKDQGSKASFERLGVDFDEMYFSKWMTFLTSIACAVYGIAPDEINFESFSAGHSALSGNDTAEKLADSKDKGLQPLLAYYEGIISDYIIADFDERFIFRWTGIDDDDEQQRYEMRKLIMTVNEARSREGMAPMDNELGDAPLNPSLISPWLQLTQQQQQGEQGDGEYQEGDEEDEDSGDDEGDGKENADNDESGGNEDNQEAGDDDSTEQGDDSDESDESDDSEDDTDNGNESDGRDDEEDGGSDAEESDRGEEEADNDDTNSGDGGSGDGGEDAEDREPTDEELKAEDEEFAKRQKGDDEEEKKSLRKSDLIKSNSNHDRLGKFSSAVSTISSIYDESLEPKNEGKARAYQKLSKVARRGYEIAFGKDVNMDLDNCEHVIDIYAVRHINGGHDRKNEKTDNQIGLTKEDFQKIPEIVSNPDYMIFGGKNRLHNEIVFYLKKLPDGTILQIDEERGIRKLALDSMRKYPTTTDSEDIVSPSRLYARNDSGDKFIIVNPHTGVKLEISREDFADKSYVDSQLKSFMTKCFSTPNFPTFYRVGEF